MLPLVGVPSVVADGMVKYRGHFCRTEGFNHVSRYVTGLILSCNKTLQGIYAQQVWQPGASVSRQAMHAAVFEAGWDSTALMQQHREHVAADHQGQGREVISLDWTFAHHERGEEIFGVKRSYDYVQGCMSCYQTVLTAVVANRRLIDGLAVDLQRPDYRQAERGYLKMTAQQSYTEMTQVWHRLLELLHHHKNCLEYRKRTEIAVDIVQQLEAEGHFPQAHYAFDNGLLCRELTQLIEQHQKHWVSELERSRLIQWQGQWRRVDAIAAELAAQYPERFRPLRVRCRNEEVKQFWAFTKTVRLKKYGRKRLVIVHELEDLSDEPRFLLTDALHWESSRVIETWSYRWSSEIFHEYAKQATGLEAAQVRKEEAVKRHFRLSCVAQSLLQRAACGGTTSERFKFAHGAQTLGQKLYGITRQALQQLLQLAQSLFARGQTCEQVLEVFMPT